MPGATYSAKASVVLPANSWVYRDAQGKFVIDHNHQRTDSWKVGEIAIAVDTEACINMPENVIRPLPCAMPLALPFFYVAPTAPVRYQKYGSYAELNNAICSSSPENKALMCRNENEIFIEDVCNNWDKLPEDVKKGSSLDYACKVDW
jgi:hypothetical protein